MGIKERFSTNYNLAKGLEYITCEDLLAVELNAGLLDLKECYELLFIEAEHLSDYELAYLKKAHNRGKQKAVTNACDYLFQRMKDRNGSAACIEYLRNAGKFTIEGSSTTASNSSNSSGGFSFNVVLPEGSTPPELKEAS